MTSEAETALKRIEEETGAVKGIAELSTMVIWPDTAVRLAESRLALARALTEVDVVLEGILSGCPPEADDEATEHGADHALALEARRLAEAALIEAGRGK